MSLQSTSNASGHESYTTANDGIHDWDNPYHFPILVLDEHGIACYRHVNSSIEDQGPQHSETPYIGRVVKIISLSTPDRKGPI